MRRAVRNGFTLVELLVVITIIGILISLLMPAVQAAREAGRRAQCLNNLKQMSGACLQHESQHGHFPTSGWGWGWAGDPDRGFTRRQPGGWHYNILPYMQLVPLHDLGADLTGNAKRDAIGKRLETPVPMFNCPTRRRAVGYPYPHGSPYYNCTKPSPIGRSDYAACSGSSYTGVEKGPGSLGDGDGRETEDGICPSGNPQSDWDCHRGTSDDNNGVIHTRSQVQSAHITDGLSSTYLIGERTLNPDNYYDGRECANDQGWDLGYDYDVNRWTRDRPMRDTPGWGGCERTFGSAHPVGFQMALCDGSCRLFNYDIQPDIHRRLGARNDDEGTVDVNDM